MTPPRIPHPVPFWHRPLVVWVLTLALVLSLASVPAVTRVAVTQTLTVHDIVFLRCAGGALVLLPVLLVQWRSVPARLWRSGLLLAFCHGWGMHMAAIAGLQFAPAGHAAALGPGFVPVWVAVWTWVLYRGLPSRAQCTGLLLIALGGLALLATATTAFQSSMLVGDSMFLLSSALAGAYLAYVQRHNVPALQGAALVAVYSGIVYVPWFLWAPVASRLAGAPAPELLWQALFQGAGAGALFIVLVNYTVVRLGGQRFSILAASVPALALLFGRWIAGDGISAGECVAVGLVSGGVLYGAFAGRRPAVQDSPARADCATPSKGF